jgi:hypothetical protein
MNFRVAQEQFGIQLKTVSSKVNFYFWRLSGDEPNSLCRLLGMEEEELKVVLCLCKVYTGDTDNFSKNNFEVLMGLCECDFTTYRINNKVERFIRVGKEGKVVLPKDMYDEDGKLSHYPIEDEHVKSLRTKSQRGPLPNLVNVGNKRAIEAGALKGCTDRKQAYADVSPKTAFLTYIEEIVNNAGNKGDGNISKRARRKLQRLMVACVDGAARDLLHSALEKFAAMQEDTYCMDGKALLSPDRVMSTATFITPEAGLPPPLGSITADVTLENETVALDSDDDIDEDLTIVSATTADEFISSLKEEVLLQTLLHKRIHDKKERVFQLEHRMVEDFLWCCRQIQGPSPPLLRRPTGQNGWTRC